MNRDISEIPEKIIYLDKNAPQDGDGTKAAPYRCFSCAFDAAKRLLSSLTEPAHVILNVAGGEYSIRQTLTLTGEDMRLVSQFCSASVRVSPWGSSCSRQAARDAHFRVS